MISTPSDHIDSSRASIKIVTRKENEGLFRETASASLVTKSQSSGTALVTMLILIIKLSTLFYIISYLILMSCLFDIDLVSNLWF